MGWEKPTIRDLYEMVQNWRNFLQRTKRGLAGTNTWDCSSKPKGVRVLARFHFALLYLYGHIDHREVNQSIILCLYKSDFERASIFEKKLGRGSCVDQRRRTENCQQQQTMVAMRSTVADPPQQQDEQRGTNAIAPSRREGGGGASRVKAGDLSFALVLV